MNKTSPSLSDDEVSVKINLILPDSIFGKPKFEGTMELTEEQVKDLDVVEQLEVKLEQLKKRSR